VVPGAVVLRRHRSRGGRRWSLRDVSSPDAIRERLIPAARVIPGRDPRDALYFGTRHPRPDRRLPPTPPATFFLTQAAGLPCGDILRTRSTTPPGYGGIGADDLRAHDAPGDAVGVARALSHVLRAGRPEPGRLA
jgi:hypothetical protein